MRPWQAILIAAAALATFDHLANGSEGIEAVADWLVTTVRGVASAIHGFVMTAFGE
jgi:hypothetical protein